MRVRTLTVWVVMAVIELEAMHRLTVEQLDLAGSLAAELDRLAAEVSRAASVAHDLRAGLALGVWELEAALGIGVAAAQEAGELLEVGESLEVRATRVDPRTAIAFNGYYGEDGGFERPLSKALVWATPAFDECVPDWALRSAWPQLAEEWDALLDQAWARCHPAAEATG